MNLETLMTSLRSKNIAVSEADGELVVRAPQGAMDAELMSSMKRHKLALLEALKAGRFEAEAMLVRAETITPDMLTLVDLSQDEIDAIIDQVEGGAAAIRDIYPLAPLQEGILFHHLLQTQGDPYITRSILVFDRRERLDAFLKALQTVIARHDILRSSVHWQGVSQPVQVVHRHAPMSVEELPPAAPDRVEQVLLEHTDPRRLRMALQRAPLLAGYSIRDSVSGEYWFALLNHHLIDDNYTLQLILSEIRLLLDSRSEQLPKIEPFRNFIARMRSTDQSEHERYFRSQLHDIRTATVPFGLADIMGDGSRVEQAVLTLETDLARRIRDGAKRYSVTAAALFHVAWASVLRQCSGCKDVVFGTVLSGRLHADSGGADKAIGMFINTLPIRFTMQGPSVREVLAATHRNLNELLAHEQASLALAQKCSGLPPSVPLFTSLLNYRHSSYAVAEERAALFECEGMRVVESEERTNYPLTLSVDDYGQGFALTVQCAGGIEPKRINGYMQSALEAILASIEEDSFKSVELIDIISADERRQLLEEFNATSAVLPTAGTLQALFEAQVEKTPEAKAVAFSDRVLSYAELNARANRLAHYLIERGVGPDVPVGLCVERSLDMAVGLLGILKTGGAYVPLDPHYPKERLAYMVQDSGVRVLLTHRRLAQALAFDAADTVLLDGADASFESCASVNPIALNHPQDLAYIIYTSGSTGQPKGVMVSHANAVHSTGARLNYYPDPVDAYLLLSSFAFDSSVAGLFWTLSQGGCLVLPEDAAVKDPAALKDLIVRHRVSHLLTLPSFYNLLLQQAGAELATLSTAIVAGEACAVEVVKRHYAALPQVKLYNEYGPTEGTVWCSAYLTTPADIEGALPIGRPIDNMRLYILDRTGNPVPIGVAGELYVGGEGVTRGYWQRPALTAERFVPDPFDATGGRLYKTGDVVRYRTDGNIEFLGRTDHQVKIRGFRIELGEIEAKISEYPTVEEVVVLASDSASGDKKLIAYVVGDRECSQQLREFLFAKLPAYMVPSQFIRLEQFPLSANGKVDRKSLPEPCTEEVSSNDYTPPETKTETILTGVWLELLDVHRIGRHDDFFELGGHSLLASQLQFKIQQAFPVKLSLKALFENPSIAAQARLIEGGELDDDNAFLEAEAVLAADIVPLAQDVIKIKDAESLLLTGATGFLGAFLLAELLEQTQARIYCLIRDRNEDEALDRLKRQIARFELTPRIDYRRIVPVCGDLAEPKLGVSSKVYDEIAQVVDAIVHNGALVNFVQPYRTLKAANVLGTEEVLRLAGIGKAKAVHYISTLSVFSGRSSNEQGFSETDEPRITEQLRAGYPQSKWVAEKMVRTAAGRGFQITVYRPGTVAGDSQNGAWNTDDFLCRVLKGCVQLGCAPNENGRLDMAPVDYISRAIVALSMLPQSAGTIFHLNHTHPPYSLELLKEFVLAGLDFDIISYNDWVSRLAGGAANIENFALTPLLALFQERRENSEDGDGAEYDCRKTQAILEKLGVECPPIDGQLIKRYRDFFTRSGFLEMSEYS